MSPSKPSIRNYTVDRDLVNLGETVTLKWETDAASVQLCNLYKLLHSICLPVATSGSTTISIGNARRDHDVQSFGLIAGSGPNLTGEMVSRELAITVKCPASWFLTNPPDECARPATRFSAIAQRFERGWMIELQREKRIFLLFEDSSQGNPYNEAQDTWQAGMPDTDLNILPPIGMSQPKHGLGLVWRTLNRKDREMLGWATQPELAYDAVFQCNAGIGDAYARCYLLSPDSRVIVLGRGTFYHWSIFPH